MYIVVLLKIYNSSCKLNFDGKMGVYIPNPYFSLPGFSFILFRAWLFFFRTKLNSKKNMMKNVDKKN